MPYEVVSALGIKEGDEMDFLKYTDKYFIFAKKSDIVSVITGKQTGGQVQKAREKASEISPEELDVLKKLDTLRYNSRTKESVSGILTAREGQVLQGLLKRKVVKLFRKENDKDFKYSIPKDIYDRFLFGKRGSSMAKSQEGSDDNKSVKRPPAWEVKLKEHNKYAELLEANGYVVLTSEAEATGLSTLLEESIRLGLVVGTRAFNKRFYVALKGFVSSNAAEVLGLISKRSMPLPEIAKELDMEEDAARTVLYLLSESGDVTEVRRDIFKAT